MLQRLAWAVKRHVYSRLPESWRAAIAARRPVPRLPRSIFRRVGPEDTALEIGPFYHPAVTGPNAKYFDVLDASQMRARAAGLPNLNVPEVIDFVSPTGDMSIIQGTYDYVVSSHAVEHAPDLITHFKNVERILKPDGKYLLVVPDKRYCFDHFVPETTILEVLAAHAERRMKHPASKVLEQYAVATHNDAARHWHGDHADPGWTLLDPQNLRRGLEVYEGAHGSYIDVHSWRFSPQSFQTLTRQLFDMGLITLRVAEVVDTPRNMLEFGMVMSR